MLIEENDFSGFISGNEKAFENIFGRYYKTLVSFSMRFGLRQMEAEDVVIDVVQHIWEIRQEIKSPAALHSLFFTAVRNRTVNVSRNIKNRERIIGEQKKVDEEEFRDYLMEEEVDRLLNEAIKVLPTQCRQVVMALLAGKSVAEIAVQMEISQSSVKTYKSRAIEILKVNLKNYPFLILLFTLRLG